MPSAQKQFLPFLYAKVPKLARRYREWYSRSNYAPEAYSREISARVAALRTKYNLAVLPIETAQRPEDTPQLTLGFDFSPGAQDPLQSAVEPTAGPRCPVSSGN